MMGGLSAILRMDTKRQVFKREIGLSAQYLLTILDQQNGGSYVAFL